MDFGLTGRVALITGAASGIGRATALALAAEGAQVIVADLSSRGEAVVGEIGEQGGAARYVTCDVADEASIAAAVRSAIEAEGQLDIMINNAGIGGTPGPLVSIAIEDWDRIMAVNLRGVFLGIKHAARAMQRGGAIVNIASIAGVRGAATLGPYGASKAGVIQLTQTAAQELVQQGIRVNAICPGWVETAILGSLPEQARAQLVRSVPMKRLGQADEVARLVTFLASDAASFISGSVYTIDGGMTSR